VACAAEHVVGQGLQDTLQRDVAIEESGSGFTTEELWDFLRADWLPIEAGPSFKEELREKMWGLVQLQLGSGSPRGHA
jgi:hypothetical protein